MAKITTETAKVARLKFADEHAKNSVHMVGDDTVITTTAKCLMGGGNGEGHNTKYPPQCSLERMATNKIIVQRRQRLKDVTGVMRRVDVHELTEMSEDRFERMIQEMTAKVQQMKVQADAAAYNLQSSSMSQMCDAIQRFCEGVGVRCWMVDSNPVSTVDSDSMDSDSEEAEADCTADHACDPAEEVKETQRKKRREMREARALAANKRCPVTQHVEAVQKERTEQVAAWARQGAEHREAVIRCAQETVCRDYDLNEDTESYVLPMTESEAICVETKEIALTQLTCC